ncbi:MAG: ShlB/FhaC/HecB family hemolysin secretion/activation protein [Pseudomonadota bacterium]
MTKTKASRFFSLLACSAILSCNSSWAQGTPPVGAELAVQVNEFRFTGNSAISSADLASLLKNFPGRSLTMEQLTRAAEEVQSLYRARGWFLARAYLPPQGTRDGVVEIAILEGRLDQVSVVVAPGAPISAASAEAIVHTFLHRGDMVTEGAIEHPLLLLRDVPRVAAKSVLEPGGTLGSANLVVNVGTDPALKVISGRVELDNYGTRATGRTRLTGEVNINNPYGLGDQLSLRAFIANAHGNTFGRASYTLPLGPWGGRVGLSLARLNYQLGEEFTALNPTGVANVVSLNSSLPLLRSKDANLLAQLVLEHKKLTDEIELLGTKETSSLGAATMSLNGDWRDSAVSTNQVSLAIGHGKLTFDDPLRQANDASPAVGLHQAGNYTKSTLSARRTHQLGDAWQAVMSLSAQMANKNLPGAERLALGGPTSVRAFPLGEVIGDQGYSITLEMQYAMPALQFDGCSAAAIGFYDFGRVKINHSNPAAYFGYDKRAIGGPGIGLNLDCSTGLMLRLGVATPTQGKVAGGSGSRAWIMAGYGF